MIGHRTAKACLQCGVAIPYGVVNFKRKRFCGNECAWAWRRRPDVHLSLFWGRVDKSAGPDGCWIYNGHRNKDNYGGIRVQGIYLAHRLTWTLENGPIPKGLHCLHKCDNPPCVNPGHLFLGDDAVNMLDKKNKGRTVVGEGYVRAIMTEAKVRELRRRREETGETYNKLGPAFGISYTQARAICLRIQWKHVK